MKNYCTLALMTYALCSQTVFSQTTETFEYVNPYQGISITFPLTWYCEPTISDIFGVKFTNKAETKIVFEDYKDVYVLVAYSEEEMSYESSLKYFKESPVNLLQYTFISERKVKIDGKDFYSISYSYKDGAYTLYATEYMMTKGRRIIVIKTHSIGSSPDRLKVISEIVFSFKEFDGYSEHRKIQSDSLVLACWKGNYSKANLLMSQGAGVNDVNSNGLSPLHAAAASPNFELFSHLISIGADPNAIYYQDRTTPIFWVNWNLNNRGKINFYQLLIDNGAYLTVKNQNHKTIYQVLKEQVYLKDDAKYLKSRGAK